MKAITEEEYRQSHLKALAPLITSFILLILAFILGFLSSYEGNSTAGAVFSILSVLMIISMLPIMFHGIGFSSYANNNIVVTTEKILIPGKLMQSFNKTQRFETVISIKSKKRKAPIIIIDKENVSSCNFDKILTDREKNALDTRTYYAANCKNPTHIIFKKAISDVDVNKLNDIFLEVENHERLLELIRAK